MALCYVINNITTGPEVKRVLQKTRSVTESSADSECLYSPVRTHTHTHKMLTRLHMVRSDGDGQPQAGGVGHSSALRDWGG
jgi:hypothetical protein